jgi:hypothetical protein
VIASKGPLEAEFRRFPWRRREWEVSREAGARLRFLAAFRLLDPDDLLRTVDITLSTSLIAVW